MYRIHKKPRDRGVPSPLRYEIADQDDSMKYLIGWPGYRTAYNKSGLGYMETRAEVAHMQGQFLYWLCTGKFRTYNPIYLVWMAIWGVLTGGFPVLSIVYEVIVHADWNIFFRLARALPFIAMGVLLLVNVILSVIRWKKDKSITGD